MGYRSKQACWKAIHAAIERAGRVPHAELEHARAIEAERVDDLFPAIHRKALAGDADAISAVLVLITFRAGLLRLDAPNRIEGVSSPRPQLASGVPSMTVVHVGIE